MPAWYWIIYILIFQDFVGLKIETFAFTVQLKSLNQIEVWFKSKSRV